MKRLLPAAFALLLALACQSSEIPSWLSVPPPTTENGVEVVVDGVLRGTTWVEGISGTATNVSGADLSRCKLSFDAYDMNGATLGTARAEREAFKAGDTWRFRAEFARDLYDVSSISAVRVIAVP
jgi:hypothetical protein